MRIFKTLRTRRPSYSTDDRVVNLHAPKSWAEMTQDQLRYVLTLLTTFEDSVTVKTYMLVRFNGIHVERKDVFGGWQCWFRERWFKKKQYFSIMAWQVESMIDQLAYVDSYEDMDVRLDGIRGLRAVDGRLHGVRFYEYLMAEKYYQLYVTTKEGRYVDELAKLLYRPVSLWARPKWVMERIHRRLKLTSAETIGTFLWFSNVKLVLSRTFKHFFKQVDDAAPEELDIRLAIDAQVRALTDGDITKEQAVFDMDCWRALTELDNKAREAAEMKRLMDKK